jgi:hypothetical protein
MSRFDIQALQQRQSGMISQIRDHLLPPGIRQQLKSLKNSAQIRRKIPDYVLRLCVCGNLKYTTIIFDLRKIKTMEAPITPLPHIIYLYHNLPRSFKEKTIVE